MRVRTLATISIGLLSAACQAPYGQNTAGTAYGNAHQSASAACTDYGFRAGTTSFNQCVANEQQARANGRVNRDYTVTQLTVDARNACNSYGLSAGTAAWDRCVSREVDARTYRSDAAAPVATYYTDQNDSRVDAQGYRVDGNGYRMPVEGAYSTPTYYTPTTQAYSTQPVSRDEFGNRYDAQGNRVDANGRVLAMRTSQ
jgi:hypothetical protein